MAGFNLARKGKKLQENKLAKNLNALNELTATKADDIKQGSNKPSQEGFDLSFTPGKIYNLDEIEANKDRQSNNIPLVMETKKEITNGVDGSLQISLDGSQKIRPNNDDYKKYLLD